MTNAPWYLEPGLRQRQKGYSVAFQQRTSGEISAETLKDYEVMRANMMAGERGATPADRLRAVLALENAERVRAEYPTAR